MEEEPAPVRILQRLLDPEHQIHVADHEILLIAPEGPLRDALRSCLATGGRTIRAPVRAGEALSLARGKKPLAAIVDPGAADLGKHLEGLEDLCREIPMVLLADGEGPAVGGAIRQPRPDPSSVGPLASLVDRLADLEEARRRLEEEAGNLRRDVAECRDAVEEKVVRRTIELRERVTALCALNDAKTQFLSLLSHKIRTPLTAIIGFSEIIAAHLDDSSEDRDHMVQSILRAGIDLGDFLNDALEFLGRSTGSITLTKAEFDLVPHLQRVIRETTRVWADKNVRVVFRGVNVLKVFGDAVSIASAIERVLDNAFKFSSPGGVVEIGLKDERQSTPSGSMVLKVRDHGAGLHRDELAKIFRPMEIYAAQSEEEIPSHGLGLAIAQEVARAHGGRIAIESEGAGKGCLVTIELPLGQAPEASRKDRIPLEEIQAR